MAAASANLGQVSSDLKSLTQQLKAAKRSKTTKSSGVMRHLRCHATIKAACVIFALTAPRTDIALEFVKWKRRNKPDANEWKQKHLLEQFNEFSAVDKELMLDENDKQWNKHLATAKAWLRDHGLRDWVYGQNKDKGVAPANEHVWKENRAAVAKDDTGALRPEPPPRWKRRQINQWVLRWARRSRVLRGAFKNGERLPLEKLRAKALGLLPSSLDNDRRLKTWSQK